jgi:uncharacterized protein YodC (DUF2158 family)
MHEFKEGDMVQLKNGTGPTMTIASLEHAAGEATCVWCEGRKPQEDIFDLVALELVKKQKPTLRMYPRGRHYA